MLVYFDAVKIGLTAKPALHTTEIFGPPIYDSYREAVIDGWLIDHEPPHKIVTELSQSGIVWKKGADVSVLKSASSEVELFQAPDEIKIEVEEFNRKVITEPFNASSANTSPRNSTRRPVRRPSSSAPTTSTPISSLPC